ncbi:MAG: ECF transporter S component [Ignavibacteriae bacterium]|nr:ECF transporter S component [Ignavibacteriota bacterium]
MSKRISEEFSGPMLPFIALCVALNLTVGQVAAALKLPLYLDSLGTVLLAVLAGPVSAIVAGSFANLLASAMGNPPMMFFIPVVIVIGGVTGMFARFGWFRRWYLVVLGGILLGIPTAGLSSVISAYVFGGVTMGAADFIVLFFRSQGFSLHQSTLIQAFIMDPFDKVVTYLIVFILLRNLPERLLNRFPGVLNIKPKQSDRGLNSNAP